MTLLVVSALLAAACGSRLPDDALSEYDARQGLGVAAADLGGGAGRTTPAGGVSAGTADGNATSGAGENRGGADGTSGGPGGVASASPGPSTAGASNAGATGSASASDGEARTGSQDSTATAAASGGAGCSGGATDVGVAPNEIVVASMITDSGPLPGATAGAYRGAAAYFAKVNAEGGVCGRKITVLKGDDGLDPARARAEFTRLEPQVLAFVGNLSVADSGFIDLIEETGVPYLGSTVDPSGRDLPSVVPHPPEQNIVYSTPFAYYRQAMPDVDKMAFLFSDVGGVRSNVPGLKASIRSEDYDIVYESGVNVASPDYTSEVINMRSAGTEFAYLFAFEINMQVRLARNMRQQNFDPAIKLNDIGYHSRLIELLGDAANGWRSYTRHAPILNEDEAAQNAAVAEFLAWHDRLFGDATLDLFPVGGWADAALFVEALRIIGPEVTRAAVIDVVDNEIEETDGGGLEPQDVPGAVVKCHVMVQIVEGKWVREHPPSGYECDLGRKIKY